MASGGSHPVRSRNRRDALAEMIDRLQHDLIFAVRSLRRTRGVTAIATLSLAVGIAYARAREPSADQTSILRDAAPKRVSGRRVTSPFFDLMRVPPAMGRVLGAGDGADVIVLSDRLW